MYAFFSSKFNILPFPEDEVTARSSRFGVKVTYTDIKPPIISLEEAVQKKSFFDKIGPVTKGDAAGEILL